MIKTLLLILEYLLIILPVLIGVAYMTLVEREILGSIQRRKGPNVVGPSGILQPLTDGLKLMLKEIILPTNVNTFLFILAPVITFIGMACSSLRQRLLWTWCRCASTTRRRTEK